MRKWICGKWKENAAGVKCAVFLLLMMELCLFWSCGRAYAAQERQDGNARNLVITRLPILLLPGWMSRGQNTVSKIGM